MKRGSIGAVTDGKWEVAERKKLVISHTKHKKTTTSVAMASNHYKFCLDFFVELLTFDML